MGKPEKTAVGTSEPRQDSSPPAYYDATSSSHLNDVASSSYIKDEAPSFNLHETGSPLHHYEAAWSSRRRDETPSKLKSKADPPPSEYSIFPKDIVFYRTEYMSLIVGPPLVLGKPYPPPLFWVSIHMNKRITNKSEIPQVRLHYGPDDTYPVIGHVRFRFTPTSDVTIKPSSQISGCSNAQAADPGMEFELVQGGTLTTDVHRFEYPVPSKDGYGTVKEKFEWRHSGDPEVKALVTENLPGQNYSQETRGLKLVRVSTDEILVAVGCGRQQRTLNPHRIAGKMRFMKDLAELDGEKTQDFRLLALMSMMSIFERGQVPCFASSFKVQMKSTPLTLLCFRRRQAVANANSAFGLQCEIL